MRRQEGFRQNDSAQYNGRELPRFGKRSDFRNTSRGNYSMPETYVTREIWTAMKGIAHERGVPLYRVCREAYANYVNLNSSCPGVEFIEGSEENV